MQVTRRPLVLVAATASLVLLSILGSRTGLAQQLPTPSPEELEVLRNLTPEQQEAILRQIAGGGGAGGLGTGGLGNGRDQPGRDQSERGTLGGQTTTTTELERQRARALLSDEERERLDPYLKGDDSVIIKIDLPPANRTDVPSTAPAPSTGLPSSAGAAMLPSTDPNRDPNAAQQRQPPRPIELSEEERSKRSQLIDLIRSRNPYRLSREGVLSLPGFAGVPLAGLTEFQATVRLQAMPELRDYDVSLIRLPLKRIGLEALKPFGYDLFDRPPSTFAPVTNVPVPADYVIGPGDELNVQLYGSQNRNLTLVVGRDGRVNFPELGPINVTGQRFSAVKDEIERRVPRQVIGLRASVSMGDTRTIRVFVLGEAKRPGTYAISGLGTITAALFAAGGVKPIGSLRNIQLKRQGVVVRTLDLYGMLIQGDTTDDAKLLPGDAVFVPPVGPTISVDGEVKRPAIYEARGNTTMAEMIDLAGGLSPQADTSKLALTRIDENRNRVVLDVDLARGGGAQPVRNGDVLRISRLRPTLDSGVALEGYVHTPATFAFRDGMRLSDVVRSVDDLQANADIHYVLIRRELPPNRELSVLSADLDAALRSRGSPADVVLMPRDRIIVFDLESGRDRIINPLLNDLRLQSTMSRPTEVVNIDGRVKVPGEYPLEPGMRVTDLVRAGGGLSDSAYGATAELTRYRVVNGDTRRTEHIEINLTSAASGDPNANLLLAPFDSLSIKELPEWGDQEKVTLEGEVRFPGHYSIKRGETLKSVIARAGGLTEFAFAEGSVFTRKELKQREQRQLDLLAVRLQNDLVTLALQGAAANQAQAGTALTVGQSLLAQVRTSQAVGRLVIDLPRTLRAKTGSGADIILRDGDRLIVPKFQQEVTVIGEVQTATSHLYRPELSRENYIALSGGATRRADRDKIYVVRADGSVVANEGGRWFRHGSSEIKPGDTVVVPLDTERIPALPFWQAVTQIIYNLAISAAAVNSF